ncbi:hypothetical protein AGMMS50229_06730 [Campylobacterota bacterium]|nr:hypothetical protein AGMMS50229_06730 [Campylobacterota bacterium]
MKTIALAVMRLQPLHNGHKLLIGAMLAENDLAIVVIGSANRKDEKNPFSAADREAMIRAVFPNETRLAVFAIDDIGAKTKRAWADFVLREIARRELPTPTRYYAGSDDDGSWFADRLIVRIVDRFTLGGGISATDIRSGKSREVPPEVCSIIA